ncbi:hypothetical protein MKEN_00679900 [Mycena kentingensis (nom. inval.)]|nr:hypothetical protein MKEN_00679900 [Mycena kentingensis (nom. inval.)]
MATKLSCRVSIRASSMGKEIESLSGLPDATFARPPVDVVLLEGWCVGFCPISDEELHSRWDGAWTKERRRLGLGAEVRKEHVQAANEVLKGYIELWDMFDVFIQLKPCASENEESPFSIVYKWRQEQEHNMKALNGGRGMDDIAVKRFVDRYIPGYVFFGDGPEIGFNGVVPRWKGNFLRLSIDIDRHIVA